MINEALLVITTLVLAAFFAAMEIAFFASNKLRLQLDRKQGLFSSHIIAIFQARSGQYIATIQLGSNFAVVIYGIIMARWIEPVLARFLHTEFSILAVQTIITTLIVLTVAEFLPKALVRINPNLALRFMSIPLFLVFIIFYPVSWFVHRFSNLILKSILRSESVNQYDNMVFGKIDLNHLIVESQDISGETKAKKRMRSNCSRMHLIFPM